MIIEYLWFLWIFAYIGCGVIGAAAWNYFDPWDEYEFTGRFIMTVLLWPGYGLISIAKFARARGIARREAIWQAAHDRELEEREVNRILREST